MQQNNRFYKDLYPNIDDLVITKAVEIRPDCVYVELLEYGNMRGMIGLKDISERRLRSIKKIISIGKIYPLLVINVDEDKKYIDLSNKYITEKDTALDKYNKFKILYNIVSCTSYELNKNKDSTEILINLLEKTLWKFEKDKCFEIFYSIKENNEKINIFDLTEEESRLLLKNINHSIQEKKYYGIMNYNMTCYEINSLDKIKNLLSHFTKIIEVNSIDSSQPDIILKIDTSPKYKILYNSNNKLDIITNINELFSNIINYAKEHNINVSKIDFKISNNLNNIIEDV